MLDFIDPDLIHDPLSVAMESMKLPKNPSLDSFPPKKTLIAFGVTELLEPILTVG